MKTLYKKFKQLTGKRGADLAESNNCTRQYISLMVNSPTAFSVQRLSAMMVDEIEKVIEQKENEIQELLRLQSEIAICKRGGISA